MALLNKSMFLYGFQVTQLNRALDFRTTVGGDIRTATLNLGFYSLTSLLTEITRAMKAADQDYDYTWSADRTINSGSENRVTVTATSPTLELLFLTGPRNSTSCRSLIGFSPVDYTGATTYTGISSAGTSLVTTLTGYNFLGPDMMRKVFGSVNISASGAKEAIVYQVQRFFQVEFKYEPEEKVLSEWAPLLNWMIQQRVLEFTPNISDPDMFYECTLETTTDDGKGLGYKMTEMLPNFPFLYQTGLMKFRQVVPAAGFI